MFHWRVFPPFPIDNMSALDQVIDARRTVEEPLPESVLTKFYDTQKCH